MSDERLEELVAEFVGLSLGRFEKWLEADVGTGQTIEAITPPKEHNLLVAILEELGSSSGLRHPWEVHERVVRLLGEGDIEPSQIAKGLRDSLQPFSFSVRITQRSDVPIRMAIGGPRNLKLTAAESAGCHEHLLSGEGNAGSSWGIVDRVQESVADVLGACVVQRLIVLPIASPSATPVVAIDTDPPQDLPLKLTPEFAGMVDRALAWVPDDLDDLARARIKQGDVEGATGQRMAQVVKLVSSTSQRAAEIRNAVRLYLTGCASLDYARSLMYSFMCLEGLLLERKKSETVQARLAEAVAYRIGRTAEHRAQLRGLVRHRYEDRSSFVHTGLVSEKPGDRDEWNETVCQALRREIAELTG